MALTVSDLELSICEDPHCNHEHSTLYLHAQCHKRSPVSVSYTKGSKVLRVECAECGRLIAEVVVGEAEVNGDS